MKIIWKILVVLVLVGRTVQIDQTTPAACYFFYEEASYDISELYNSEVDYSYVLPDTSTLYYNYCKFVKNKCNTGENRTDSYAVKKSIDNLQCTQLTSNQLYSNLSIVWSLIEEESPGLGVQLLLKDGDSYSETLRYQFKYVINCNQTQELPIKFHSISLEVNTYIVNITSARGCPKLLLSSMWTNLSENDTIFSVCFFVVGLGLCFMGHYLRFFTLFTVGFLTGFGGLVIVLSDFVLEHNTEDSVVFVLTMISLAFGVLMAYLTTTLRRAGIYLLGMWVGVIMALLLNNTVLYKINKQGTVWIAMLVIGTAFGLLGLWLKNRITIICSSFIGAYFTIRPLGWYIGHWPNEFTLVKEVQYGLYSTLPNEFYLYLLLILMLTGLGMFIQFKIYLREKKREQEQAENEDIVDEQPKGFLGKFVNVLKGKKGQGDDDDEDNMGDDEPIMDFNFFKKKNKAKKRKASDDEDEEEEGSGSDEEKHKKKNKKKKKKQDSDDDDDDDDNDGEDSEEEKQRAKKKKTVANKAKANGKKGAEIPLEVENKRALNKKLLQDEDEVNTWA